VAATCMPGGAGDWQDAYSGCLHGREVIIVADRDEPGVKHAMKVKNALQGIAASALIVQSRTTGDHDDAGDHLDAGFTLDELVPYHPGSEIADRYTPVDWRTAWKEEAARIKWLVEPVLEEGTLCALYGRPGDGKSLITLWLCLQIVRSGGTVLMCDDENTRTDLVARLKAFGASPEELDNLITLNFASLPPLDTPEGGRHLTALADKYSPAMITLDTISRMVEGEENSATTYLQLYRNSMTPLKARWICVLRIDHSGKETARGQRGSSAKSGDVDVVWRLSRESEDFLVLEREKSRNGHGDPTVVLQKLDHPCLHFEWDACSLVDGQVIELAKRLDRYGAALDCTRESAEAMLHEYSIGARHEKVSAALKYRRDNARGQGTRD
jgi:KaiC/GvpD/RAD55 family RecA-like ATPase